MKIKPTELRTQRLLLRPWRLTDIEDAFAYGSDPEWGRYLWNVPFPYTRRDAEDFVRRAAASEGGDQAQFALERRWTHHRWRAPLT